MPAAVAAAIDSARAADSAEAESESDASVAKIAPAPPRPSGDEDAPWPMDEAGEAAFLGAARESGVTVAPLPAAVRDEAAEDKAPLPPLDTLVARIPAEVRETLEDLFRVKFTTVRRVPAKHLNT